MIFIFFILHCHRSGITSANIINLSFRSFQFYWNFSSLTFNKKKITFDHLTILFTY
jgi:hypothetical protein